MNTATPTALVTGTRVVIVKGCNARDVVKGTHAVVTVTPLGAEYGHSVRVTLQFLNGTGAGRLVPFYARHLNRLSDPVVRLNDGNPLHVVEIRRA
jgi:hypothetical protein